MISSVLSTTFSTLAERWKAILGATVVAAIALILAMVLLMPMVMGVLTASISGGAATGGKGAMAPSSLAPGTPGTVTMTVNGQTQTVPMQSGDGTLAGSAFEPTKAGVEKPGPGAMLLVVVVAVVIMTLSIATASIGVFAATGSGVGEAIREGIRTSPHGLVQSLKLGWPALVTYLLAFAAILFASPIIGLVLLLVSFVLILRAGALVTVAIGSIAHGHVTYSPELAREALQARMGAAIGANVVGGIVGGVIGMIPLAGPVFMSAFISAMWEEFGDGVGPTSPGSSGSPPGGSGQAEAPADWRAAETTRSAAASAIAVVPPIAAVASAPPAEVAAPENPAVMAGPTWYLDATPSEPAGSWIQLEAPGRVALQVQWATGEAPALQFADQAGAWRTPPEQPAQSGDTTWHDFPAGYTWVAVVPRAPQQQLWVSSMLPGAPGAGDAALAA
ncbi:MAG: hypothetical protein JWL76_1755 [Thermoleophilia bacterium]|nr:hypothetical protein [Thermoleophilia bacterium]